MPQTCIHCFQLTSGFSAFCEDCRNLRGDWAVKHSSIIRCPDCENDFEVNQCPNSIWQEGEHTIECVCCENQFQIVTEVKTMFLSPALIKQHE